ncbi:amidase [Gluconacetobacter tumulicola]|uniref:amidase n=1 Tax=Gluconacetobacter tumulicola TaxID=1017177 RepID=UPI001C82500D|nr:amidase [Gluconacetobacter tumulicola]
MTHPLDLTAREIADGIRTARFSAQSVVAESIRRAEIAQARLNPFTLIRAGQAMEAARRADAAVAEGAFTGPLHGVPFVAKDLPPTEGDLTTLGSWMRPDWRPEEETALCIRRLQAAGAIPIGKTTTPEFAYSSFTRSPGGSSGGSAVTVATGVVPFAEGTDMGGSVRIPAAFCGVVGFKPSLGRIPMTILPSQFDNISHFGPLARTVADAISFMEVTAGGSDEDIASLPIGFDCAAARTGSLRGRRFALSLDLGYYAVQPQVVSLVRQAAELLRRAGAIIDEVAMGWTRAVNDQWFDLWCVFMSAYFGDDVAACGARVDPAVVAMIARGRMAASEGWT